MDGGAVLGPQRFGRYVLLDRMGVGGMAEVFRAIVPGAEGFKRDLVVKKILTEQAQATNFIEMFVHEARISALLHHPNVVQVFDFGQVDGNYFLAMELLRGRDLRAMLRALRERQRPLPVPIAAHVAQQVAVGLAYAHGLTTAAGQPLNIIHRDVSPSNIMCLRTGGVKLLDFGIAQALGEIESSETKPGAFAFKGKLRYMAPERVLNQPQDHRVDLFALGAVLWEMLTGRRLFQGRTMEDKVQALLEGPIPAPSSLRADVPAALDAIVARALARDPERRYPNGQEMADALEAVVGETRYHSRMLPALLTELFGSAPSAAQMTLSTLSPDLLTVDTLTSTPATLTSSAVPVAPAAAWLTPAVAAASDSAAGPGHVGVMASAARHGQRVRAKVLLAGTFVAVVIAAGLVAWPGHSPPPPSEEVGRGSQTQARTAPTPTPEVHATTAHESATRAMGGPPAAKSLGEPAGASGANADPSSTALAAPTSTHGAHRPLAPKAPTRLAPGRIARGLSIDPFAEAAARGAVQK